MNRNLLCQEFVSIYSSNPHAVFPSLRWFLKGGNSIDIIPIIPNEPLFLPVQFTIFLHLLEPSLLMKLPLAILSCVSPHFIPALSITFSFNIIAIIFLVPVFLFYYLGIYSVKDVDKVMHDVFVLSIPVQKHVFLVVIFSPDPPYWIVCT